MADPIQAQLNATNFMIDQMIKYLNLSRDRLNDTYSHYKKEYATDPEIINEIFNFKLYQLCLISFKKYLSQSFQQLQYHMFDYESISQQLLNHVESVQIKRSLYPDSSSGGGGMMTRANNSSYMLNNNNESNLYGMNASNLVNAINANNVTIVNNNTNTNNTSTTGTQASSTNAPFDLIEVVKHQANSSSSPMMSSSNGPHSFKPAFVSNHRISSELNMSSLLADEPSIILGDMEDPKLLIGSSFNQMMTHSRTYEDDMCHNVPLNGSNSALSLVSNSNHSNSNSVRKVVDSNPQMTTTTTAAADDTSSKEIKEQKQVKVVINNSDVATHPQSSSNAYNDQPSPAATVATPLNTENQQTATRSMTQIDTSNSMNRRDEPRENSKSSAASDILAVSVAAAESKSTREKNKQQQQMCGSLNNLSSSIMGAGGGSGTTTTTTTAMALCSDDRSIVVEAAIKRKQPKMKLLNKDVYVRQNYPVMSPTIHYNCYITYIENPMLFCVHLVDDVDSINELITSINAFYKNETNSRKYQCQMYDAYEYYAAQFQGEWYRARILDIYAEEERAVVFYFDYGNCDTVPFDHIRLLDKSFRCIPYFAYPLSLAHAVPRRNSDIAYWSSNDILTFKNFGGEDELVVSVLNDSGDWPIRMCRLRRKTVVDINKDDGLNYMKEMKRARRVEVQTMIDTFKDQMLALNMKFGFCEKYLKKNMSTMLKQQLRVKALPEERVVLHEATATMKKRVYLHASLEAASRIPEKLIELDSNRYFKFQVSHYVDPNHFYINLIDKRGQYVEMCKKMNEFYAQNRSRLEKVASERNYDYIMSGNLCVVHLDSSLFYSQQEFHRGLFKFVPNFNFDQKNEEHLKDSSDRHKLAVLLIDSGKSVLFDFDSAIKSCLPLMSEYATLPPRCIAATSKIIPMDEQDKWSDEAVDTFEQILSPYALFKESGKEQLASSSSTSEIKVNLNSIVVIKFDYGLLEMRNEYVKLSVADQMISKGLAKLFMNFYERDFIRNNSSNNKSNNNNNESRMSESESIHDMSSEFARATDNRNGVGGDDYDNDDEDYEKPQDEIDLSCFDKSALVLQYVMNPENPVVLNKDANDRTISVPDYSVIEEDDDQVERAAVNVLNVDDQMTTPPYSQFDGLVSFGHLQSSSWGANVATSQQMSDETPSQEGNHQQQNQLSESTIELDKTNQVASQQSQQEKEPVIEEATKTVDKVKPKIEYVEDARLEEWHPLKRAYESVANNYFYDEFSVEARINGYETSQSKDICQNNGFRKYGVCTNRYCNFLHEKTNTHEIVSRFNSAGLAQSNAVTAYTDALVQLGLVKNKHILIQIQSIYEQVPRLMCKAVCLGFIENDSFDSFAPTMNSLFTDMQNHYSQISKNYVPVFRQDQIVAAKSGVKNKWLRAKVLSIERSPLNIDFTFINVFFLDLGDVEEVPIQNVCPLHKKFLSIPFYYCTFALVDNTSSLSDGDGGVPFQFERFSHVYKQISVEFAELIGIVESVVDRTQNLVDLKVIGRSRITNQMVLVKDYLRQQLSSTTTT